MIIDFEDLTLLSLSLSLSSGQKWTWALLSKRLTKNPKMHLPALPTRFRRETHKKTGCTIWPSKHPIFHRLYLYLYLLYLFISSLVSHIIFLSFHKDEFICHLSSFILSLLSSIFHIVRWLGIFCTNSFHINDSPTTSALFPQISRLNHSCR